MSKSCFKISMSTAPLGSNSPLEMLWDSPASGVEIWPSQWDKSIGCIWTHKVKICEGRLTKTSQVPYGSLQCSGNAHLKASDMVNVTGFSTISTASTMPELLQNSDPKLGDWGRIVHMLVTVCCCKKNGKVKQKVPKGLLVGTECNSGRNKKTPAASGLSHMDHNYKRLALSNVVWPALHPRFLPRPPRQQSSRNEDGMCGWHWMRSSLLNENMAV